LADINAGRIRIGSKLGYRTVLQRIQTGTIYSLLLVIDDFLVAEDYFNGSSVDQIGNRQSVAKSYISALVGIALDQNYLASVDLKMLDFFPELDGQISDPRKQQITIQHLLQMRASYPGEERDPALLEALWSGDYLPMITHFPLVSNPGIEMKYSNLSTDWLGMIVARAFDTDLKSFSQEYLFSPLGLEVGSCTQDQDGFYIGHGEIHFTAHDMAKFGLLYLNLGELDGEQIIPPNWVRQSLTTHLRMLGNTR
jgi:CubicO group peptidase (beta-lactamase class C family)